MADATAEVVAPLPDTPEYEAAMAAKVDESAAKALEAAEGSPIVASEEKTEEAPEKATEESQEGDSKEDKKESEESPKEEAKEAVEAAGLDYSALQTEWESGGLSEESYQALEKVGFSKDIVDQHIAGMEALATVTIMQAEEAAGGKEQLGAMQAWAVNGMSKAEIESYNKAVSGSKEDMLQAVTALRSRYEAEYGRQPGLLGGSNSTPGNIGYGSRAEMTADMRNPLYAKDPAFRAKVTNKIAATTAF